MPDSGTINVEYACFNPHPAFRPGDAGGGVIWRDRFDVSIRTRPFGRVMHANREALTMGNKFQSAPGLSAG